MSESNFPNVDSAAWQEMEERTGDDWGFMASEIGEAIKCGVALDDQFIEDLAQRRFERCREEFPMEKPGATIESSLSIVREVVAIHQIALESVG